MSKKRFDNVWDAIEDTPAQAENHEAPFDVDHGIEGSYRPNRAKPVGGG